MSIEPARRLLFPFGARLLACLLAFIAGNACLAADEFKTPAISSVRVEWRAVLDALRSEISTQPSVASAFTFSGQRRVWPSDPRSTPALVQLNAVTSEIFPGIGRSPVPVLLPFDTAGFLAARLNGAPSSLSVSRYQADFRAADMFDAGPAGYDAVFSLEPGAGDGMPQRTFAKPVEVQITGSILTYDIDDPLGAKGEPVKTLAAQFPDLRRFIREGYVRYAFTRFGVPYVVSIQCLDSVPRAKRLACREAYPVAERFLKALRIAGGKPSRPRMDIPAGPAERPAATSADFTYLPPGDIIPGSGYRRQSGRADFTSYSQIRFPLQNAPDFVNSQSFRDRRSKEKRNRWNHWRPERKAIHGGIIFARPAISASDNAPAVLAIRARISARPVRRARRRRALRSAAAGCRRRPRRRADPLAKTAGGDAADQYPHRAHAVSLHAHESRPTWTPTAF